MNSKEICIITNIGSHYRFPIFKTMEQEFSCDFFLGDHIQTPIKTFNYRELKGYRKTLKNLFFYKFYWQRGSVELLWKPYTYYILDGEPFCLSSWVILLLAKWKGKKTIAWTHGWYGRETGIKRIVKRRFYGLFSKLMLYNDYAIKLMIQEGFNPEKLYRIGNSLDSDKQKALRSQLKLTDIYVSHFGNQDPTLIYCGRLQKCKKLTMIIDSMAILVQQGIFCNAIFVGKDIDSLHLQSYVSQKGLSDRVWMYGPCYNESIVGELFYNAAVCVSPGNIGLTAIHALSFGCPVITHNHFSNQMPEFEAVQPGITGDFFEEDSIEDLTSKIQHWISMDFHEREKIRSEAYKTIDQKWNIHYQIHIIKKVINEF